MLWKERTTELAALPSIEQLASQLELSLLAAKILRIRMSTWREPTLAAAKRFLKPSFQDLPHPLLLKDMDHAVERVVRAIEEKQAIAVYGDYDVDGTCAAAILRRFFRALKIEPFIYQPDRVKEGYGLNKSAVESLAKRGIALLITVDCGISNASEIATAKELGLDVIVCDHHQVPPAMPDAVAVLNHKRVDDDSPITTLCGAGMSFYLTLAVRAKLRELSWFERSAITEPDLRQLLDLVALASVADLVPLREETRILTSMGLQKMRSQPTLGIKAICERAGADITCLDTYHLGFVIGPRINASGRLDSARFALDLLSTESPKEAEVLAEKLESLNRDRIQLTQSTFLAAQEQAKQWIAKHGESVEAIVLSGEDWHEGVIGIVASRIQDEFHRPTLIVTYQTHTGLGKGSARAGGTNIHLAEALQDCAELLEKFGGHQAAAGLSVSREKFAEFAEKFVKAVRKQMIGGGRREREQSFDAKLGALEEVSESLVEELARFAPFGMENPEPILLAQALELRELRIVKEKHLKLSIASRGGSSLGAFWPNGVQADAWSVGDAVNVLFSPQISHFRGKKSLEMRIRDMQR